MDETNNAVIKSVPNWRQRAVRALYAMLLVVAGFVACQVYVGVTNAIQAETTLHANRFCFRLVEQFVVAHHRWPLSWAELEQEKMTWEGGMFGADWPAESPKIQKSVAIDFAADPARILQQSPLEFAAIQPIDPYYECRDLCVPQLQKAIRRSIKGLDTKN